MKRPRDELLARPALSRDEDPRVRRARAGDLGLEARHRGALAEKNLVLGVARVAARELAPEVVALAGEAAPLERLLERQEDALEGERLLEEVVRAALDGRDGRLDGPVPRDHDDGAREAARAEAVEDREAVHVRQPDVEEDGVGQARRRSVRDGVLAEADGVHRVALVAEDLAERLTDPGLVVADEDARRAIRPVTRASRGRPLEEESASVGSILLHAHRARRARRRSARRSRGPAPSRGPSSRTRRRRRARGQTAGSPAPSSSTDRIARPSATRAATRT